MKVTHVQRRDWLRFGVFLALVAGITMYVASRYQDFRQSRRAPTAALPASGGAYGAGAAALPPQPGAQAAPGALALPAVPAQAEQRDFFAEFRLERDRARGQEREMLQEIIAGANATDEARQKANLRYLALSTTVGLEAQLEGLIRGRGYADAVVVLGEGTAQVVVKAPALTSQEAARIGELVRQVAGVKPTGISIVTRER